MRGYGFSRGGFLASRAGVASLSWDTEEVMACVTFHGCWVWFWWLVYLGVRTDNIFLLALEETGEIALILG